MSNIEKLIDVMIENEFKKIEEFKENSDMKNNKEYHEAFNKSNELFKNISKNISKDSIDMLYDYDEALSITTVELEKYYFKQGIIAAFNELKCLQNCV